MSINVADLLSDPDFVQRITVKRTSVTFVRGGTQLSTSTLTVAGYVSSSSGAKLDQRSGGDRKKATLTFYTLSPIYATDAATSSISDIIVVDGEDYRLFDVNGRPANGFWKATGERTPGA